MSFTDDDITNLIREVGKTIVRPKFRNLKDHEIRDKGGVYNPVTDVDEQAEEELAARLKQMDPDSVVIGEEGVESDPALLDELTDKGRIWILDPIDGTHNFATGDPNFGVMVALVEGGAMQAGWIYNVMDDVMTFARRGGGITQNGASLASPGQANASLTGYVGVKLMGEPDMLAACNAQEDIRFFPATNPSAVSYVDFVKGNLDFLLWRKTNAWDHCPGLVMAQERCAVIHHWNGENFDFTVPDKGLAVARNEDIWQRIDRDIIQSVMHLL